MLKRIKPYMMPLAMLVGGLTYPLTSHLAFCTPYLIAVMLFISYCNISTKDIRFSKLHIWLLGIQILGGIGLYFAFNPFNHILAEGVLICVLAPTATSAIVITQMLDGNTASLTAYSILSNLAIVIVAPLLFAYIGDDGHISFSESVLTISKRIFLLLLLPFVLAILINRFLPTIHKQVQKRQSISFYLWTFALVVITGKTVRFIVDQKDVVIWVELCLAALAFVFCILQFVIGKMLGERCNDRIAGGQGLGQKNTILAIWMAQSYLNPISSIAPGTYVLWQNIINSYQIWNRRRNL